MPVKKKHVALEDHAAKRGSKTAKKPPKSVKSALEKVIEKQRVNVVKYIKLANRFERQKLGRRQTEQRKDPVKLAKVEAEIEACKNVHAEELADRHLRKTFAKIRTIRECENLPMQWRLQSSEQQMGEHMIAVSARLYSHQTVRMAMNKCIDDMQTVISVATAGDFSTSLEETADKAKPQEAQSQDEIGPEGDLSEDSAALQSLRSESDSNLDESDDDMDEAPQLRKRKAQKQSEPDTTSESQSSETEQPRRKKAKRVLPPAAESSAFFPSLTAVGYAINSDSEASDLDEEVAPRKNRRGQRARQAIWEKKYKEKAKHFQKQAEQQAKRDEKNRPRRRDDGWDARKGAVGNERPGYRDGHRETGANVQPILARGEASRLANEKKEATTSGPLHPSWEAKKLLKAKQKMSIGAYSGSKITF